MKRRLFKRLLITLLALVVVLMVLVAVAFWWLTRTHGGASFALNQAERALPGLSWSTLDGNLADGLTIDDLALDQAGAEIRIGRIDLTAHIRLLGGLLLEIERLHIEGADIVLPPTEDSPDSAPFELPDLSSPVPVRIGRLSLVDVRILAQADEPPLAEIERLELTGAYADQLVLEQFEVQLPQAELAASGRWQLAPPHAVELSLNARTRLEAIPEHRITAELRGPLDDLEIDLDSQGPARFSGPLRVQGLPQLEAVSIRLDGQFSDWPELDLAARAVSLALTGSPNDWQLEAGLELTGSGLPDNRIQARLNGGLETARLDELIVDTLDGRIVLQGQARWAGLPSANLAIQLDQLDLTPLYPELPAQARLNGEIDLALVDARIVLEQFQLSAPPSSLTVAGSGRYDPAGDQLELDLSWQNFTWPPMLDQPDGSGDRQALAASERGQLKLSGRLSEWQAELDTILELSGQPKAAIEGRLQGDLESADIESLAVDLGAAGQASISGQLGWRPALSGDLSAVIRRFDPGVFVAQLPGQVSARLDATLRSAQDLAFELSGLEGELRGQTLDGAGTLELKDGEVQPGLLWLQLGDNRFDLDGQGGERWRWQIAANALDQLWPELLGKLEASGSITPASGEVMARGQLTGAGFKDITLDQLDLNADLSWQEPTRIELAVTARDLDLNPWERIDLIELNVNGRCRQHRFDLNVNAQRGTLDLGGSGQWPDCLRGGERWAGALEQLYLGDTLAGDWQLKAPMPLSLTADLSEIGPGCLQAAGSSEGQLCLEKLRLAETGSARLTIDQVPMDLLLLALDPTLQLSSRLSAELDADWTPGAALDRLHGFLALGPGQLTPLDSDQVLLELESLRLDLESSNGGVLAELLARLEGQSEFRGAVGIDDLGSIDRATINGELALDLPDIGVFNRLIPELDDLSGRLDAELALRGRLVSPQLEGRASLSDGGLKHAPLGLSVEQIELDLRGSNLLAELEGRMRSGDGHLALTGELRPDDGQWAWRLHTEGERFSLAGSDWLDLSASPDLSLSGRGRDLDIDGDIRIDRLRAGLPPGNAARVSASEDVEVLGETDPEDDAAQAVRLDGRLGISLGNDARLSAVGLETSLAGDVELLWNRDAPMPRARGLIRLPEGSYRAYGQNLEIEDGEILLTGHPVDNPRLDIEAVRDIFGDPQVERAGVSIRGNAQSPEIKLFTDPPTSEEKALAYVVTGADFDHAGGQGAVNVGFYLLPKLFVSYGIGLFENGNVLSGRYELSRRWGVRVVSGERDTGVDLSYAIDR